MCMCVPVYLYVHNLSAGVCGGREKGVTSPGPGKCELHDVDAEKPAQCPLQGQQLVLATELPLQFHSTAMLNGCFIWRVWNMYPGHGTGKMVANQDGYTHAKLNPYTWLFPFCILPPVIKTLVTLHYEPRVTSS